MYNLAILLIRNIVLKMDRALKYSNYDRPVRFAKQEQKPLKTEHRSSLKKETIVLNPMSHHEHPYAKFLRGNCPELHEFKKFAALFYKGLYYSVNNLKGPSETFIKKKSVALPQHKEMSRDKFLLLDLDETLIHSIFNDKIADVTLEHDGNQFRFNIRPYCLEFLEKMSYLYSIYVYTASTIDYASPIVEYLNKGKKTIHGILHRKNCMETNHGFFIKDLRIVKNRKLSNIVMVDNLIHSFGLQIDNGIPILDFIDNKHDMELYGLEKLLIQMVNAPDIPEFLRERIGLRKMVEYKESQVLSYFENHRV